MRPATNPVNQDHKRSAGLIAIVCYKVFSASLLAITSIALLLAVKNHQQLAEYSNCYILNGKQEIIKWFLDKILNLTPQTLKFSGIAAAIYSGVTVIEAIGLWQHKAWATLLVMGLVAISIPPEIFELSQGISTLKLTVFLVNIAIFLYLLRDWIKSKNKIMPTDKRGAGT
ncbi:MAG: DUF2127 domain-containing protein [Microcoleus vaginatus WJT46-NPBG5]|jgi:uncharacterized membrane protein (DUF2068 family)|nr:DUF2127 domain-containing protein [Microcoleus vaginatus WJT46-NPBG5]